MAGEHLKRGRWRASRRRAASSRLAYREPAPDALDRAPPSVTESGRYQALHEHWLVAWLRRLLGR